MSRSSAFRFVEPILGLILILSMFGSCMAHAQVVQPTYVRPSKGANIQVFSGVPPLVRAFGPVFDFSGFSALQVTVEATGAPAINSCRYHPRVITSGSLAKTGPFALIAAENAEFTYYVVTAAASLTQSSISYTVNQVAPFIQMSWEAIDYHVGANCTYKISMTPLPLQTGTFIVRNVALPTPPPPSNVSIPALPDSIEVVQPSGYIVDYLRFQNVGTVPVACGYGYAPDLTYYSFNLSAGVVADDGKGGALEMSRLIPSIKCGGVGGVGKIAYMMTAVLPQ